MTRFLRILLELLFWGFTTALVMSVFAVMIAAGVAPVFAYGAPALLLILLPMVALVVRAMRERRAGAVLIYLEQAVRLNLPLPRMMLAAKQAERAVLARRLDQLRMFLQDGFSVSEAVESAVPESSTRTVATIAAAEQIGQLAPALHRLTTERQTLDENPDPTARPFHRIYPLVLILCIGSTVMMFAVFVMPKFQQIFADFNVAMPAITTRTIDVTRIVGPLILIFGTTALLVMTGRFFWETVRPFGVELTSLGIIDRILWGLPFAHGVALNRGMADACALIGDAIEAGIPIERALIEAARLPVNEVLQLRLMEWADFASEGMPIADAARKAHIPAVVAGMLGTTSHSQDTAAVFRFFERYYRTRFSRTQYLLQALIIPLIVLGLAFIVACVALSLFVPMTTLVNHMASQAMRY